MSSQPANERELTYLWLSTSWIGPDPGGRCWTDARSVWFAYRLKSNGSRYAWRPALWDDGLLDAYRDELWR